MRTSFRSPLLLLVLAILIHAGSSCRSAPSGVVGAPSAVLSEAGLAELRRTLASFSLDGDLPGSVALVEQAGELRLLGAFGCLLGAFECLLGAFGVPLGVSRVPLGEIRLDQRRSD